MVKIYKTFQFVVVRVLSSPVNWPHTDSSICKCMHSYTTIYRDNTRREWNLTCNICRKVYYVDWYDSVYCTMHILLPQHLHSSVHTDWRFIECFSLATWPWISLDMIFSGTVFGVDKAGLIKLPVKTMLLSIYTTCSLSLKTEVFLRVTSIGLTHSEHISAFIHNSFQSQMPPVIIQSYC